MRTCSNCGKEFEPSKRASRRCGACRSYWAVYGEERPERLTNPQPAKTKACTNCGISLETGHRGYNRCNACHMYHYRTGQERPRHLYTRFAAWAHAHPGETP